MFAYCGNSPVNSCDPNGEFGVIFWSGVAAAVISGISNAISTACNGGSVKDCLVAGAVGAVSGAVGFATAAITGFSPVGSVLGRAVASTLCDLGTAYALNGEITGRDLATTAVDVTMDVCFSTIGYYYTEPINSELGQNVLNASLDGTTDVVETILCGQNDASQVERSLNTASGRKIVGHGGTTYYVMLAR